MQNNQPTYNSTKCFSEIFKFAQVTEKGNATNHVFDLWPFKFLKS